MAKYRKKKIEYVTMEEFVMHWNFCKAYRNLVYGPRKKPNATYLTANVTREITRISLTYRRASQTVTYISRLDDSNDNQKIDGVTAYSTMQKYYKVPDMKDDPRFKFNEDDHGKITWIIDSKKQLQYYNPEYSGKRIKNCYGYDLNSSFSFAMLQPIPDTSQQPRFHGVLQENEIGFLANGDVVFDVGERALIVFPAMESPFERFVSVWYRRKKNAKNEDEKQKAKQILNYAVGYLQRKNPFIRNTIVQRSNDLIEELIDDNTLYCNTDSIVSMRKRRDIEKNVGQNIGQWKIEHKGDFAFRGFTYQWNLTTPTYKGIPKNWFTEFRKANNRNWDLLKDKPPNALLNIYDLNIEKMEITKKEVHYDKTTVDI